MHACNPVHDGQNVLAIQMFVMDSGSVNRLKNFTLKEIEDGITAKLVSKASNGTYFTVLEKECYVISIMYFIVL